MDKGTEGFTTQEAIVAIAYSIQIILLNIWKWIKKNFHRIAGIIWFIIFSIAYGYTSIAVFAAIAAAGAFAYSVGWIIYNRKRLF